MSRTKQIWEKRYKEGGNSGAGSYNHLSTFKSTVVNNFIKENQCNSLIDFGCGDGNQLKDFVINEYTGLDISDFIVRHCKELYKNDLSKKFYTYEEFDNNMSKKYDLALSLDVIYHLVDDDVYTKYLSDLFNSSSKYVIIYSSNFYTQPNTHIHHRLFTKDIEAFPNAKLVKKIDQKYPTESSADFYIYEKI